MFLLYPLPQTNLQATISEHAAMDIIVFCSLEILFLQTINMEIKVFVRHQKRIWLRLLLSRMIPPSAFNCLWHIEHLRCSQFGPTDNLKCRQADATHKQIPGIKCYSPTSPRESRSIKQWKMFFLDTEVAGLKTPGGFFFPTVSHHWMSWSHWSIRQRSAALIRGEVNTNQLGQETELFNMGFFCNNVVDLVLLLFYLLVYSGSFFTFYFTFLFPFWQVKSSAPSWWHPRWRPDFIFHSFLKLRFCIIWYKFFILESSSCASAFCHIFYL